MTKAAERRARIDRFVERDLGALARAGQLARAHLVDDVVSEVAKLLADGAKHPMLVGEPGVGKTAIVQELAARIAEGRVPAPLAGARILEVALASMRVRVDKEEKLAPALEELLDTLAETPTTIVFLRDAWLLGGPPGNVVTTALRDSPLRFVIEGDARHAEELLREDEALAERVHVIAVDEPSPERARAVLGKVAEELEDEGLAIAPAACDAALRLSSKFLLARRHPRKSIELLRESVDAARAAGADVVGGDEVLARFCEATRLPRLLVDDRIPLDLADVEEHFAQRILGQRDAVAAVLRSVALLKAGLNDPRRPLGAFLFAGPTGVGKTHLAKLLAEYLFGSADRLVRINMSDFPDDGDELVLFGNAWSHTREAKRGSLTKMLEGKAFAVLLLDEFEKAHRSCHDRFMQLFDEGRFINAAGETVPCNNTLIVATSNVGSEVYREPPIGFGGERSQAELTADIDRRIAEAFRPEFVNRFDAICHFRPLDRIEIRRIAQREVGRVLERDGIRARGLDVDVAPEVIDVLVERGYSPAFGARFLQREIEKTLTLALAVEIMRRPPPPGTPVSVRLGPGKKVVAVADVPAKAAEPEARVTLPARGAVLERRRLHAKELVDQAMALVARAQAVAAAFDRDALEARRAELLAATQAPTFWDDPPAAATVLRAFREVEAHLGELDRLGRACAAAVRRARAAAGQADLLLAARAVEQAAREVQLGEARVASGSALAVDEALVDVCAAGRTARHRTWALDVARMYQGWAERRGYAVAAVAEGEEPAAYVLKIEGPGVLGFLAGERGLHRRIEGDGGVGAWVRVHRVRNGAGEGARAGDVPPSTSSGAAGREPIETRRVKRQPGALIARLAAEVTARDAATGREIVLRGPEPIDDLRRVAELLIGAAPPISTEARRYHVGRAARVEDPRTGEATSLVKEVLRGEIDGFLAAWIERSLGAPAALASPPA